MNMGTIKVMGTEINIEHKRLELLKEQAREEGTNLEDFLKINLQLKWSGLVGGCGSHTMKEVLVTDIKDITSRYQYLLDLREDIEAEGKAEAFEGKDFFENVTIESMERGIDAILARPGEVEDYFRDVMAMDMPKIDKEIRIYLAEVMGMEIDTLVQAFAYRNSLGLRDAFFFLAGLHSMQKYSLKNEI
jgi:hypothetical protein